MEKISVIGIMSGSSLDGVDLACVNFWEKNMEWKYEIEAAESISYSANWKRKLQNAFSSKGEELIHLHLGFGRFLGEQVFEFIQKNNLNPQLISSHGHTVFHRPEKGWTLQIGDGQQIANASGIKTVNDFRSEDVQKGGQGAPLVPVGDKFLFSEYPICLNIGGIANVSFDSDGKRVAFDICIANQALNYLAQQSGYDYDHNGDLASFGTINDELLNKLNDNSFYSKKYPKSLGREFFESNLKPLFEEMTISTEDALATFVEHIAVQIAVSVNQTEKTKMLVTGGGAFNNFLISRIQHHSIHEIVVPEKQVVDFKEAIIFAFLGLLRVQNKTNVLSSVTGASSDSCSGKIWLPKFDN